MKYEVNKFLTAEHSEEFKIDVIFFRKQRFYRFDSLCLEKLTNFGVKGAKRSVKVWTTNFYRSLSKNILLYMSSWPLKIRSVHTYVMHRVVYFG